MEVISIDFTQINDEYLIGITNKGIVKRSYKDMESLEITHTENDNTITVNLDDVVVTLTENLLESTCTCPSRSTCKHIIISILHCKATLSTSTGSEAVKSEPQQINEDEIFKVPVSKLLNIVGTKKHQQLISLIQNGYMPQINESLVVTIVLDDDHTVKLITPLEYSMCACKSKEICKHKALSILYYMFYKKKLTLDDIMIAKEPEFDFTKSKLFCSVIKQAITDQLLVGLARISESIVDKTEKLSISCNNYKLATLQQKFREISNYYDMYFKHHTHFKEEILLNKLSNAYMLADCIEKAETYNDFIKYAGVFREEYEFLTEKVFIPIGERYMETLSGYAGMCYYFLEESSLLIYSYSNIRPNFYDKSNRSSYASEQNPWSINSNMKELMIKKFTLANPKVSGDRRISSSSEIKGKLLEDAGSKFPKGSVTFDFRKLIYIDDLSENDKVSIVSASKVLHSEFDKIRQVFSMQVEDINGFSMYIELPYTNANEYVIRMLEKYCKKPSENTIFIGIVYLEDQKLKMFPIEYIREWEEY